MTAAERAGRRKTGRQIEEEEEGGLSDMNNALGQMIGVSCEAVAFEAMGQRAEWDLSQRLGLKQQD